MTTQELVALYFDNLPADQLIKPTGAQIGGQIKNLLKSQSPDALAKLIPIVAKEGKPLSLGTLMIAQSKVPASKPTYSPPPFNPAEIEEVRSRAVPMPQSLHALKVALRYNGEMPQNDGWEAL
jgi:hypothetical protein